MGAPSLSGRVSAVIWLQRSNAVTHLKRGLRQQSGKRLILDGLTQDQECVNYIPTARQALVVIRM